MNLFFRVFPCDVLQVCQEGRLVGDRLEIFDREFYFSSPGHCEEMQDLVPVSTQRAGYRDDGAYGVGGAPDDIYDGNGIEEGLASDDVPKSPDVHRHEM